MEKKIIIETIKQNKKAIIKKTLIVAGTVVGLLVVVRGLGNIKGDPDGVEIEEIDVSDEIDDQDITEE